MFAASRAAAKVIDAQIPARSPSALQILDTSFSWFLASLKLEAWLEVVRDRCMF